MLNLYTGNGIEGSNPSLSTKFWARLAQLDRALDYESKGQWFESTSEHRNVVDERFMTQALQLAREAEQLGEVPVGAVVVVGGEVVGRGYNRREVDADPLSHAELKAIAEASQKLKSWRLSEATLYVTLEPCTMCAGALIQARLGRLVFGAMDPKAGAVGSLYDLLADKRLNHEVEVTRGVMEVECGKILKDFFVALRGRKKTKE